MIQSCLHKVTKQLVIQLVIYVRNVKAGMPDFFFFF